MQITDLKKWDCYFAPYPKGKHHRIILIDKDEDAGVLQFLTIQSFIDKVPVKYSYISIPKHFWDCELTNSFSFIVCEASSIVTIEINTFINLLNQGKINQKQIPDIILSDIKKGILKSVTFTDEEKKKILD